MTRSAGRYLRISLDRTGEGLAVERQREDCGKLIGQRGWVLAEEFVDNDTSAAGRKPRPGFDALLAAVETKRITVIVAYSLDRLTRNRRDQLRLIETCQQHNTLVALVRGSDVDMSSAVGRAMADMMAVWARMEIEQKSERQVRAWWAGGARSATPPTGWRSTRWRPRW
jgi:DNA invertase Pin-like site-specific DNA recombinase